MDNWTIEIPSDQEIFVSVLVGSLVMGLLAIVIGIAIFRYLKRSREFLVYQEQVKKELSEVKQEMRENTMHSISQELHDHVVPNLIYISRQVYLAKAQFQQEKYDEIYQTIGGAINDLRDFTHLLHPTFIEKNPLPKLIEKEVSRIQRLHPTIKVKFTCTGEVVSLQTQTQLFAFRIFQESLSNAIKHAEAKNILAKLSYNSGVVTLEVTDDGKGFDPLVKQGGIGVLNMNNRSKMIEGNFQIIPSLGSGTRAVLTFPVTTKVNAL